MVATKRKKGLEAKFECRIENAPGRVFLALPVRTVSEVNQPETWRNKHARHKSQKRQVIFSLGPLRSSLSLPACVRLTRFAPRPLDAHDNLPISFKWIYDSICDILLPGMAAGRADDDPRITVEYKQVKSKNYGIEILITSLNLPT